MAMDPKHRVPGTNIENYFKTAFVRLHESRLQQAEYERNILLPKSNAFFEELLDTPTTDKNMYAKLSAAKEINSRQTYEMPKESHQVIEDTTRPIYELSIPAPPPLDAERLFAETKQALLAMEEGREWKRKEIAKRGQLESEQQ